MRFASITERLADLGAAKWSVYIESRRRAIAGESIIQLAIGEPDTPTPQVLIDTAVASLQARRIRYSRGQGEPVVQDAIAAKYAKRTGRPLTAANAAYMPGTQSALFIAIATLAEAGDEVLVGDPCYATYEGAIRASGADMTLVPLNPADGFHLKAADLEARITPRSRVLLLNSPHNPTGATLSFEEIVAIVEVCRRHDLWIVSDEVYETLAYGAPFVSPFDLPDGGERTVVVSSLSKSHMIPGLRAGWCVGPVEFIKRMLPLSEMMLFCSQPFIQDMAAVALKGEFAECTVNSESFARRAAILPEMLANAPGLTCKRPEGGMFAMVDVSGTGVDGETFAWRLLDEEKVAVMPGGSFGRPAIGHIRVALSVDPEQLREAASRMVQLAIRLNQNRVVSNSRSD